MNVNETHLAIAKERFLELMAQHPNGNPAQAACQAIEEADKFKEVYNAIGGTPAPQTKKKGCRTCYGSGGKPTDPCKVCSGSGKVDV